MRRRALDAARSLVERGGADALQLRRVATEVGSGVASLYYHFTNKDALRAAVAVEGWRELAQRIEHAMASGRFPHRIDAANAALLAFIRRSPNLYALMQIEPSRAGHLAVREAEHQAFEAFQSSLRGDDRVPADRVEDIARLCWVLGRGIASTVQMENDAALAERLEQAVLRGFAFLLSPQYMR
ncbi:TetR/AcrR family transcriptional regulator [Phenylobacterium aquaticum]|uniref:TetR/AcrR family transcriptional regulator n=1 Tax=Phenylobacterium aquaticum TaxID=1763816 RepID=UPI001F5E31A9|nr:TetR/AcrR family transcriptional regulator [Phenylobacterium aquaticum]MCI3132199.1 TetR/AcrR family transcriptional regulator [Phenylobacterium aquaticum]